MAETEVKIETPETSNESSTEVAAVVNEAEHHAEERGYDFGKLEQCVNQLVETVNGISEAIIELQESKKFINDSINSIYDRINKNDERIVAMENITETPSEETPSESVEETAPVTVVEETPPVEEIEIVEQKPEETKEDKPKRRFFI